jgi:hypothetical protein
VDRHVEEKRLREGEEELRGALAVGDEEVAPQLGQAAQAGDGVPEGDELGR